MKKTYYSLNTKSHYSCGLAIGTSEEIIERAKLKGLSGLAITDKNTLSGVLDFFNKGKELKFPIIIGTELNLIVNLTKIVPIILLAKTQDGYFNLCKLLSIAWENEVKFKTPCVETYHLSELKKDLYCLSNEVENNSILSEIYKEHFYNEIVLTDLNIENNKLIVNSGHQFVVTLASNAPDIEFKIAREIMIANGNYSENKNIPELQPIYSLNELLYIYQNHSSYLPMDGFVEGLKNTNFIGEDCSKIELKFKDQIVNYPHLLHPLNTESLSKEELVWKIAKVYGRLPEDPVYIERFKYEMDAICNNSRVNLIDYFLVLEDLCSWCRENNIMVGPGRGSGAGSLINYCLRITNVDPIKFKLFFERFLSKGRIEKGNLPDIDCLDKNTLITKANGEFISIEELSLMDDYPELLSFDGINYISQKPITVFKKSFGKLYEYEFDNNIKIRCTNNHKVMLCDGTFVEIERAFLEGLNVKTI